MGQNKPGSRRRTGSPHVEGDGKSSKAIGIRRNIEVRCLLELDDDETFKRNNTYAKSHTVECLSKHTLALRGGNRTNPAPEPQCPVLKERLARHKQNCHGAGTKKVEFGTLCDMISLSPALSMDDKLSVSFTQPTIESCSGGDIKKRHTHKSCFTNRSESKRKCYCKNQKERKSHEIRQCETVILRPGGVYKDNLQNIILQWLIEIPVLPSIDQVSKIIRDNAVHALNEAIYDLALDINADSYDDKLKTHIDSFLEDLPIWFPCSMKEEQQTFRTDLKNNLFDRIKNLNREHYNDKNTYVRKSSHRNTDKYFQMEQLVLNYISNLKYIDVDDWGCPINVNDEVKKYVAHRLKHVFKVMSQTGDDDSFLKSELVNILGDLPLDFSHNMIESLDKYAQDLTDDVLAVLHNVSNRKRSYDQSFQTNVLYEQQNNEINRNEFSEDIMHLINNFTDNYDINNSSRKEEFIDILLESIDSIQTGNELSVQNEIYEFLNVTYGVTEQNSSHLTKAIIEKIKSMKPAVDNNASSPVFLYADILSKDVAVYVSDHDLSGPMPTNYPITSTPKKSISKLNAEEKKYMNDLTKLINGWIEGIPVLSHIKEDANYKNVMVSDLAGHLIDEIKLEQYAPDKKYYGTRDNMLQCAIRSWIIKFEDDAFKIIEGVEPFIDDFIQKFSEIQVPILTMPQYGTRKDMKAEIFRRDFSDERIDFIPEGTDIIEDGISIWMNEQSSQIFSNENRNIRNNILHDFALKIHNHLKSKKRSSEGIKNEARLWLDKILKPDEKKNIELYSEIIKDIIVKMPLCETLDAESKINDSIINEPYHQIQEYVDKNEIIDLNLNKTLTNFIEKFIEHNCEEDDSIVKGAFCELLKTEFQRLSPQDKSKLTNCDTNLKSNEMFPQKLTRELHYIKEISDWLKNIPIDNSFNVSGNKDRIEFIVNLARDINKVEMEGMQTADVMEHDKYLSQLLNSNYVQKLPILPNCKQYQTQIAEELLKRVIKSRYELSQPLRKNNYTNDSLDIEEQNIGEFIDEYIRINGKEIADDPEKLEVWTARVVSEINRMMQESESSTSLKNKIYNRLAEISIPGNDSITKFDQKLMYAHEIGDWIKNMPLQSTLDQESTLTIVRMISELAEKLSEKQINNIKDDAEQMDYVMKWILTLPLEPGKEVDTSVLIQQLSNRVKRVNNGNSESQNNSNDKQNNQTMRTIQKDSKSSHSKTRKCNSAFDKSKVGNSGELIVGAIEDWCNKLPIKVKNGGNKKNIKDNIAIKLFQKVGDLNLDPKFNDDILYRDQLNEEVDSILEDMQEFNDVMKEKDNLKTSLVNSIVEARGIIREHTAGDLYRNKLENTIESSLPSPVTKHKIYDPGFELYKTKLANMFILENFDHSDDPVKLKYEVKIKDEIDKYFSEAQKRNAVPLSRDEIYNELYSALFKVPIPNESSVIQEVEEVKLRCEIDGWFEGLPIREAVNLNELLDWDKILAMLTKRIYELEKNDLKAEDKIHNEITKWLVKFPFLPGEENNIDKHAKSLEDRLKSSKNDRKCTPTSKADKVSKKGKSLKKTKSQSKTKLTKKFETIKNKSQTAGPSQAIPKWTGSIETSDVSEMSLNPCCIAASTPRRKPADIIQEIVESWCQSLPLNPEPGQDITTVKDNLMTNILRKIIELNANPEIFDDDFIYEDYLDDELDRLFKALPMCCELQRNSELSKYQLISALRTIKPLIRAERARHEYKKEIRNTIKNMLQVPLDTTPEKAFLDDLIDEVADSFVQYNYNKDDYEGKQIYKNKIRDAIIQYYTEVDDKSHEDTLIKQNKLLCELAKIPIPSEAAIKEDVEEIKMKEEVSNFLEEVIPDENIDQKKQLKNYLSKRLTDIEKSGHSCATDKTMKEEIARSLKKLNTEVNLDKIDDFVNRLKNNEAKRKATPLRKSDGFQPSMNVSQQLNQHGWQSGHASFNSADLNYKYQPPTPQNYPTFASEPGDLSRYQPSESIKYYTLLPEDAPGHAVQDRPETMQWYQPGSTANESQHWQSLPANTRTGPLEVSNAATTWHTLPSSKERTPPEALQSSVIQGSGQLFPATSADLASKFLPRAQTRRQTIDIPTTLNLSPQQRASLQTPLRYNYDIHDNRSAPKTYKELCVDQNNANASHPPTANVAAQIASQSLASTPRPLSPTQARAISPRISIPTYSNPTEQPITTPRITLPDPAQSLNMMSSRPLALSTQNYQGFQNAVAGVSSPTQPVPNIPISTVPQSTRNAASIRQDGGPTISNIPHVTPEGVSSSDGAHRMAADPQIPDPPRKRQRILTPDEEELCECFLGSRKKHCMPFPEGGFWCYMPFPSFCYF
ncbi:uncharacterized protein LOC106131750 [Amyelois transitella]|uniref:uncharacterized protein LOC106131750 n=1 Tax=Amyelois transitella TaxID=680683 RepID=UPI00298F5D49|nr:uncharacterized protein LOC106131750 [Amyelois transitella]